MQRDIDAILSYWFGDLDELGMASARYRSRWFKKDPSFDAELTERFSGLYPRLEERRLDSWLGEARSLMAYVLLADQFSRNIFRNRAQMYAQDALAVSATKLALSKHWDETMPNAHRVFLYMPLMHSEILEDQQACVELFERMHEQLPEPIKAPVASNIKFAQMHRDIVERFGRFPHRNEVLGRESTAEELAFLQTPGSSF